MLQHLTLQPPPSHPPGKAETCQLPGYEPMAPQCPDTDMVMRQTVCARMRVREVSTASRRGQGMRHGVRMGNGTPRAGEEGLREPRGQRAATLPLSTGPVWGTSCPFLLQWLEIPHGAELRHEGRTPVHSSWYISPILHGRGCCTHWVTVPGPTCLWCPALSWAGKPALMDFAFPCAHPHPAPCLGGLSQPAAALCLPPSLVYHAVLASSPTTVPMGLGLPGHSHTNSVGMPGWCGHAPSHPPNPCPCPLLSVSCPSQEAAGQADWYLWPSPPPAVATSMAKGGLPSI